MMPVAVPAFLFTLVAEVALQLLHSHSLAIEFAILPLYWVAQSLVLTPLAIAVHRYVLLEEVTPPGFLFCLHANRYPLRS